MRTGVFLLLLGHESDRHFVRNCAPRDGRPLSRSSRPGILISAQPHVWLKSWLDAARVSSRSASPQRSHCRWSDHSSFLHPSFRAGVRIDGILSCIRELAGSLPMTTRFSLGGHDFVHSGARRGPEAFLAAGLGGRTVRRHRAGLAGGRTEELAQRAGARDFKLIQLGHADDAA